MDHCAYTLDEDPSKVAVPVLADTAFGPSFSRRSDHRIQPGITDQFAGSVEPVDLADLRIDHQSRVGGDAGYGHQPLDRLDLVRSLLDPTQEPLNLHLELVDCCQPLVEQQLAGSSRSNSLRNARLSSVHNELSKVTPFWSRMEWTSFLKWVCLLVSFFRPRAKERYRLINVGGT